MKNGKSKEKTADSAIEAMKKIGKDASKYIIYLLQNRHHSEVLPPLPFNL